MRGEDIEADGRFFIGGINDDHFFEAFAGNEVEQLVRKIAVRVQQTAAEPILDVLADAVEEERRFAVAGAADDVRVPDTMIHFQPHGRLLAGVVIDAEQQIGLLCERHRCRASGAGIATQLGADDGGRGQMHEARQFLRIQQHASAAALPSKHVLFMGVRRILPRGKRHQLVPADLRKRPQAGSDVER